eukprot:8723829-Heterocapsa_arctica.AAC.1
MTLPPPPLPPPPPPLPPLLSRTTCFLRSFNCSGSRAPHRRRRMRFDLVGASLLWPSLRSSTWS